MTTSRLIETIGRDCPDFLELEETKLRDSYLVERHEQALYRRTQTRCKGGNGVNSAQTIQRPEVQQEPGKIEKRSRDGFLRFREEWVRNRARDIREAGSISFNTCSEDTASITALNEFYRSHVFEQFRADDYEQKELKVGMTLGPRVIGSFSRDLVAAERHMSRTGCRGRSPRVLRNACRQGAQSRA